MGSSTVPAASTAATSDLWSLISSVTPTASATTVSFTSISGYKKLFLRITNPGISTATALNVTFNGDTGANYLWASYGGMTTPTPAVYSKSLFGQTGISYSIASGAFQEYIQINEANTAGAKTLSGFINYQGGSSTDTLPYNGMYFGSASISTVTCTLGTGTFSASGNVALYGVLA